MTTTAPARTSSAGTTLDFELPPELEANVPPEVRGRARDDVRMLVAENDPMKLRHAHIRDLPRVLTPGDLVVINTSGTIPAALEATTPSGPARLHLSTPLPGRLWTVELRPHRGRCGGQSCRLTSRWPAAGGPTSSHHSEQVSAYGLRR